MTNHIDHTGHRHPATPAARRTCRALLTAIETAQRGRLEANAAQPYDHAVYEHMRLTSERLLKVWCNGDDAWAEALDAGWINSNETILYYLREYTRDALVYHYNTETDPAERKALDDRLAIITLTDAFKAGKITYQEWLAELAELGIDVQGD